MLRRTSLAEVCTVVLMVALFVLVTAGAGATEVLNVRW